MNGDVTVREVMEREFVGVSEADTLRDTAELMLEEGAEAVVVVRGSSPEGILTQEDVLEITVEGVDLSEAKVSDAMRAVPSEIAADASIAAAIDLMSSASTRHLLVTDGGDLAGLVSEHDVVTASRLGPSVDGEGAPGSGEPMATETVADAGQAGTAIDEGYSNQGICEVCGTLTRDLSTFNGQLVCSDCKDV